VTSSDLLLALHVLGAVVWVGGMFFALLVLRPSLGVLQPPQRMALHLSVFRRFFAIIWIVVAIMLLTGFGMVSVVFGGFADVPWNVQVMMLIGLIMVGVFVWIYFVPWRDLKARPLPENVDRIRILITANLALGIVTIIAATLGQLG
jgi:uncharacterized membrane protein